MKKILLLSDTHGHLDNKIKKYIKESDEVWHAGDIGGENIIDSLQKMKPLRVVFGNIDGHKTRLQAPELLSFNCEGVSVLITHIAGYPGKYNSTTKELIAKYQPKLLICGHSHILKVMRDKNNGHLHMNPGAAGISGFHKIRTMLRFELEKGVIKNLEAIEMGLRGALSNSVNRTD